MNKANIIGIAISLIGLFIMGIELGINSKNEENNLMFTFIGLFMVSVGAFMVIYFKKKNSK